MDHARNRTGKRAVRCVGCRKRFDDWRMLQQHRCKSCPNSVLQFVCRICKAFFSSKVDLNNHISAAHIGHPCNEVHKSENIDSVESCGNTLKINSASSSERIVVDLTEDSEPGPTLKWKKVHKRTTKSADLQKLKSAKIAKQVKKFKKTMKPVSDMERDKSVVETSIVGSNPFTFTTSCAPDARLFQFLCQSCFTVRFGTYVELREHEEWCARVRNSQGFLCLPCGRHYRSQGTLRRHAGEYHMMLLSSEVKNIVGNPFQFSTKVAVDAASYPHVCSSCLMVCFSSPADLRRHEDWCGQCASVKDDGLKCIKCGRCFRTAALLKQHTTVDDCTKTGNTAGAGEDGRCNGDAESESSVSSVKQKAAPEKIHGICPLCDVPFASQYEQQVHFMNVHNLTDSEMKVKESVRSRRGLIGTQVTCLDCDCMFSSRLELVQHKRICTKEKKFTKIALPVMPSQSASDSNQSESKNRRDVEGRSSVKQKHRPGADRETSISDITAAKHENQSETAVTKLLSGMSETRKLQISRALMLNPTKMHSLLRHSGAKRLLVKPGGEILLLGDGGQKIPTVSAVRGQELEMGKLATNKDPESTVESLELVSTGENSGQTENGNTEAKRTVRNQCQIKRLHPNRSSTAKSRASSELETCLGVDNRPKLTRKRTKQDDVAEAVNSGPKTRVIAAEVKSNVVNELESVKRNRKSKNSASVEHHSAVKAQDRPAADSNSEVKTTGVESLSEVADGQQTLLEALQLVPVTAELNGTQTVTARYRTRSSTNAHVTTGKGVGAAKKSQYSNNCQNLAGSSASSSQKGLKSLTETARNKNKSVQVVKQESTNVNGDAVPQRTWNVEPAGNSLVRCVACKVIFRTVQQIVGHSCAG